MWYYKTHQQLVSTIFLPNYFHIYFLGYLYNPTLWMGNTPFQLLYLEPLVKLYPIDIVWLNHNHSPT